MMKHSFAQIIETLADETGLSTLALDESGSCTLRFDNQLLVDLTHKETAEECIFICIVGEYSPEQELTVLKEIAAANFAWVGTGGATLGANTETRHVMLSHRESTAGLDWVRFQHVLESFLQTAFLWKERLAQTQKYDDRCDVTLPFHAIAI